MFTWQCSVSPEVCLQRKKALPKWIYATGGLWDSVVHSKPIKWVKICLLGYLDYPGETVLIKSTDTWTILFLSVN